MGKTQIDRKEADIANGAGSNAFEFLDKFKKVNRDEGVAVIKVLVVLLLIPFGILTFRSAFLGQYNAILFNNVMLGLLIIILILSAILYGFIIFPHGQETKREKTLVTGDKLTDYFTHIIALIIIVPLIVVTCILLVDGNHSEELTFISGLLGVIIGFYFGHRGIDRAESQTDEAETKAKEAEATAKVKSYEAEVANKKEAKQIKMVDELAGSKAKDEIELNRYKKEVALRWEPFWDRFKEEAKRHIEEEKAKNIKLEKIEGCLSGEVSEADLNDDEKKLKAKFEEEWERYGENKEEAWDSFKEKIKSNEGLKNVKLENIERYLSGESEVKLNDDEKKVKAQFEAEWKDKKKYTVDQSEEGII